MASSLHLVLVTKGGRAVNYLNKSNITLLIMVLILVCNVKAADVFVLQREQTTLAGALKVIANSSVEVDCGRAYQIGSYYTVDVGGQRLDLVGRQKKTFGSLVITALQSRSEYVIKAIAVSKNISLDALRRLIAGNTELKSNSPAQSAGQSMGLLGLSTSKVSSQVSREKGDRDDLGGNTSTGAENERGECEIRPLTPLEELIAFALGKSGYESRCYVR